MKKKNTITLRVTEEENRSIKEAAHFHNMTISDYLRSIISLIYTPQTNKQPEITETFILWLEKNNIIKDEWARKKLAEIKAKGI